MDGFLKSELNRALSEQLFGLAGYHLDDEASDRHKAVAFVDLLEQRRLQIKLSTRGYEVVTENDRDVQSPSSSVYETIEDLLAALSPMYKMRQMEEIITRLSQLSDNTS